MTHEERIYAAIEGKPLDKLLFVPRLDLWYQGNKIQGTLPAKYKNASLVDIVDDLGLGYHCVIPNFCSWDHPDDSAHVGLGIHKTKSVFYTVDVNCEYTVSHNGGETTTVYKTPYGDLTTKSYLDDAMIISGITQPHVTKPAVESEADYKKIAYVFDSMLVNERYSYYDAVKSEIGDRGPVVGFQYEGGSPMHGLLKEMSNFEKFWVDYYMDLDLMLETCSSIQRVTRDMLRVMADSPCRILYVGANYDYMTTPPPFFHEHIMPELKWSADYLHSKGKFLSTHTDGENKGLLQEYVEAGVDIADSVCPAPMTSLSLEDVRSAFDGRCTVWGGIAAISLLGSSMTDYEFEKYLDDTLRQCGDGRKLILGIADSMPPASDWNRFLRIIKEIDAFGAVK